MSDKTYTDQDLKTSYLRGANLILNELAHALEKAIEGIDDELPGRTLAAFQAGRIEGLEQAQQLLKVHVGHVFGQIEERRIEAAKVAVEEDLAAKAEKTEEIANAVQRLDALANRVRGCGRDAKDTEELPREECDGDCENCENCDDYPINYKA